MTDMPQTDYRKTVCLPATDFAMRAQLPEREPIILSSWQKGDLYARLEKAAAGRPRFVLHDGPPYANGHLHLGHALNKILKDVILKNKRMSGFHVPYVPGWDCHGLPIELKVEEAFKKAGRRKDDVPQEEFIAACRAFAASWINIQKAEFERLGVLGDWQHPYTTMEAASEGAIVKAFHHLLLDGYVYQGLKPVQWSVAEQTALAEAEVEYHDHTSTAIYVAFPVRETPLELLRVTGARPVIWTTTPWTMPGNRAIAYGAEITYVVLEATVVGEGSLVQVGQRFLVAGALVNAFTHAVGISGYDILGDCTGRELSGTVCHHPLAKAGYTFPVPLLEGSHVTTEQGTGLVHTAPAHGIEDFMVCQAHGIATPNTVKGDGTYAADVPLFAGSHVFKVAGPVCEALSQAGSLLGRAEFAHSYPHSWRSKTPLIYRATHQWFVSMSHNNLRQKALTAIAGVRWQPAQGVKRIESMVAGRPDWCLSRQRIWGVPIAVFVHKETNVPLTDPTVLARIQDIIGQEGCEAWWARPAEDFLGPDYTAADYVAVKDILDVWFDSGLTHEFVLQGQEELSWPADVYLEGSDQHRGWFNTSLLTAVALQGAAPYKTVVTHGFIVDDKGYKLSKSAGNAVSLEDILKDYGADILRLWAIGVDYFEDVRVGKDILKHQQDIYRRVRNTFRFLLGNLHDFDGQTLVPYEALSSLEQWILHRLAGLHEELESALQTYDFHAFYTALHQFCAVDLSAFYFDIRKDALYCEGEKSVSRRSVQTVLHHVFEALVRWFAPVLSFTAEEAWQSRYPDTTTSVHELLFETPPAVWRNTHLDAVWTRLRALRRVVTGALEAVRAAGTIGSSLEAAVAIYAEAEVVDATAGVHLPDFLIVSSAVCIESVGSADAFALDDVPGIRVVVSPAEGLKCVRCWKVLPEVAERSTGLCRRCDGVVAELEGAV